MTFDKPEHREMVLELIKRAAIPGHLLAEWAALHEAVDRAKIAEPADVT